MGAYSVWAKRYMSAVKLGPQAADDTSGQNRLCALVEAEAKLTSIQVMVLISYSPGLQYLPPQNVESDPYFPGGSDN